MTKSTLVILPIESNKALMIILSSGLWAIILRGLSTLNALKIFTNPILYFERLMSTTEDMTMKKSS